jgi:hypothetical protein
MIISIESSIPTFKPVQFHPGLNVLLADTQPESTEKQTRNSAGKTSLIEIIHFLLGASCDKDSLFRTKGLIEHNFTGIFDIAGRRFKVLRGGADPARVFLLEGGEDDSDLPKKTDKDSGRAFISNVKWRVFLGQAMFRWVHRRSMSQERRVFAPCSPILRVAETRARFSIRSSNQGSSSEATGRSICHTCLASTGKSPWNFKKCAGANAPLRN